LGQGIVVRDVSKHAVLKDCLRITIGTHDENNRVLAALADVSRAAA
jgi:histidinol-phosphate/aromatic aminotransferase/cobyric acid decarboxylase-like protein